LFDYDYSITVIIPVHNGESTIARCINSVLNQDSNFVKQILVYNDASSDNTQKILDELCKNNAKIKVFHGVNNIGAGASRNLLLKKVKTEFLAFLDSDDFWYSHKIREQVSAIQQYNLDVCTCWYDIYAENGQKISTRKPTVNINYHTLLITNWIPMSMTVVRTNLAHARIMPDIRKRQDYAYWLFLFQNNNALKCKMLPTVLGGYQKHSRSLSHSKVDNVKHNFLLFRNIMCFSVFKSTALVAINIIVRIFR
jgi:glycosyltransferase involved in cell wall biosynthesis